MKPSLRVSLTFLIVAPALLSAVEAATPAKPAKDSAKAGELLGKACDAKEMKACFDVGQAALAGRRDRVDRLEKRLGLFPERRERRQGQGARPPSEGVRRRIGAGLLRPRDHVRQRLGGGEGRGQGGAVLPEVVRRRGRGGLLRLRASRSGKARVWPRTRPRPCRSTRSPATARMHPAATNTRTCTKRDWAWRRTPPRPCRSTRSPATAAILGPAARSGRCTKPARAWRRARRRPRSYYQKGCDGRNNRGLPQARRPCTKRAWASRRTRPRPRLYQEACNRGFAEACTSVRTASTK